MNYIWQAVNKLEDMGVDSTDIYFKVGDTYSPYTEISLNDMTLSEITLEMDINPYYRFYDIFKDLFNPDFTEYEDLKKILFDLIIHHLLDVDKMQGMNRFEYYMEYIEKEITEEHYGENIKMNFNHFNKEEKRIITTNIINQCNTGESVYLFKDTIKKIFKKAYVLKNTNEKEEILILILMKENNIINKKLDTIKEIFLPFKYQVQTYFESFCGIIETDGFMIIDKIIIY